MGPLKLKIVMLYRMNNHFGNVVFQISFDVLLMDNHINLVRIAAKVNEKYMPYLLCMSSFGGASYKRL